jgi:hypothetical protein
MVTITMIQFWLKSTATLTKLTVELTGKIDVLYKGLCGDVEPLTNELVGDDAYIDVRLRL